MSATSRARHARDDHRRGARRSAARRRRVTLLLALVVVIVCAVVIVPLARKAVQHFTLPLEYSSIIRQQASEKHLEPALIAAVIYAETRFRPRTSDTGAEGLMQIEPQTADFLARRSGASTFTVADLATPQVNIAYGSYYLRYLMNVYDDSKVLALAAYNGGETNVDNWLSAARAKHQSFTIAAIPISQTRAYVTEVIGKEREYRSRYAEELGYG